MRSRDLRDLRDKKRPLGKTAYRARVRSFLRSQKAQRVAKAKFNAFKHVCATVVANGGAAART